MKSHNLLSKRKRGKKASRKQRKANRYTSQACPRCGYTREENRPQKGLLFVCGQCQYTLVSLETILTNIDILARSFQVSVYTASTPTW